MLPARHHPQTQNFLLELAAIAISSLGVEHSSATVRSGVILEELCKESLTTEAEQSMQT
jgi:hypothetical protein